MPFRKLFTHFSLKGTTGFITAIPAINLNNLFSSHCWTSVTTKLNYMYIYDINVWYRENASLAVSEQTRNFSNCTWSEQKRFRIYCPFVHFVQMLSQHHELISSRTWNKFYKFCKSLSNTLPVNCKCKVLDKCSTEVIWLEWIFSVLIYPVRTFTGLGILHKGHP